MAVLFDFDGTLVDTSPDLLFTINTLLQQHGLPDTDIDTIKPLISAGSKAILQQLLPQKLHAQLDSIREQFIATYTANDYANTELFPGIAALLRQLDSIRITWGIVTNRTSWLTSPILSKFNLSTTPACVVGVDHVSNPKPHPEPLLLASKQLGVQPADCLYIGDAKTDILAGNAAGMSTVAAMFGYIPNAKEALSWPANFYVSTVQEIYPLVSTWHIQRKLLL